MGNREVFHLHAQMLPGNVLQMMGFINNKVLIRRKQLMAGLNVCKQLGVVGHDNISYSGFVFGPVIIAFAEPGAGTSQTRIRVTGHGLPEITAAAVQIQLLIIARLGLCQPYDHLRRSKRFFPRTREVLFIYFMFKLAQTQIVPSALEDRSLEREGHHTRQKRDVALTQLVLKVDGMCAHHDLLSRAHTVVDGRKQITQGFAGTRTRLD
ncbi:hypothetical protein D3C75_411000 [compost metagenome]